MAKGQSNAIEMAGQRFGITRGKWDWLMKCNDQNAQAIIAACAGEIAARQNDEDTEQ